MNWLLIIVLVTGGHSTVTKTFYQTRNECFIAGDLFNNEVRQMNSSEVRSFYTCTLSKGAVQ